MTNPCPEETWAAAAPASDLGRGRTPGRAIAALVVLSCALPAADGRAGQPASPAGLKGAPPNTWVKVLQAKTGGRDQPIFVYASKIKRFVAAAGMQHYGGVRPRHYDTEEFDLAAGKWFNAYPPGTAQGRPESGPVGEAYARQRAMHGHNGRQLFYKDGDHLRLGAGGQWHNGKTYGEYCYVPDRGKAGRVYAYMHQRVTACYDVAERSWEDLKAEPRTACRLWGSMCYDPVNREILHAGGAGGTAEISTWVYDIDRSAWRKLDFGSADLKRLHARARQVCWQAVTLLGRCASRHAVAETPAEAEVDLPAEAGKLTAEAGKLAADIRAADLAASEKPAGDVAAKRLASAIAAVEAVGPALAGKITPERIAAVRAARAVFEQVVDALAPEPPGRARSQIAFDAANGKIVLFGGDGLDRALSDTWVYDCKSRSWQQRFCEPSPSPRAGHILAWLPKARRIVLAGGYSRLPLAQEVWCYDTAANRWTPLRHVPLARGRGGSFSPNCPNVTARTFQVGAVNDDDVLVCPNGNTVWACRVDPARPAEGAEAAAAAPAAGSYVFNRLSPAIWEAAARPDAEKSRKVLDELAPNRWTALSFPRYAPGARNRWGTTAYDTDRHQFLFWGGGHATSHDNDVAHFSVLGGSWTIGYPPDDPIERVYATQPTPISFRNRVHVPIHAYKAYCYDPAVRKMLYFGRAYDPLVREWLPAPYPGLSHRGTMHSHMESTPAGAVTISTRGLFRLDAHTGQWKRLPWKGPNIRRIWCDGTAVCYDSRRDCLWLADDASVVRYDFATGQAVKVPTAKPKPLGQWRLWGEQVYLPDADLILLMRLFARPDGGLANVAWSPADAKYHWLDLPFVSGGKPVAFRKNPFSWHDAIRYDPKLKLALINNSSARRVWAMKFDRKTAKITPME